MKNHKILLYNSVLAGFLAVMFTACTNQESTSPPENESEVEEYLKEVATAKPIVGASLVVMKKDSVLKHIHYGNAENTDGESVTENTVFQLASATKIFTGTLALMFVEQGKITLEDSLGKYLVDLPNSWKALQLKSLLSHTSGLPRILNPETGEMLAETAEASYLKAQKLAMLSPAGERWNYNQTGFLLIAKVLEKISGSSWEQLLQTHIFSPLDMSATMYNSQELGNRNKVATSYTIINQDNPQPFSFEYLVKPAGGIYTSSADMIKFTKALLNNELLQKESQAQMWSKVTLNDGSQADYGLGWDMRSMNGRPTVGHSGGRKAVLTHFPDEELTVIILTNTYGADPINLVAPVAEVYLE